ncbi:MAG: phosphodiesterase [Burkholderiaceae bacterium]
MLTSIVQLTDTHIRQAGQLAYGRLDTAPYLQEAVQSIASLRQAPQAVIMTGDLTDFGRPEEYQHLRALLAPLGIPFYLMPGNHDNRDQLRAAFPDHEYLGSAGFIQYTVDIGPLRLITLDTCVAGKSHGELCGNRLDWLEEELKNSTDRPVIIAMHHPPFGTLIGHMDEIGLLAGAPHLEKIVARHSNVERIVCGHLHRPIETRFGGTIAATAPGPAHQVTLNLAPDAESDWMLEPPAFRIHAWNAQEHRLVTHTAVIGSWPGPFPFHENGVLID